MKVNYLRIFAVLLFGITSVMSTGCEGPQGPQGLQGPQGEQGPQGPPGEDGNANATLHIFDGHDFSEDPTKFLCFDTVTQQAMIQSSWAVFLALTDPIFQMLFFHIPGVGADNSVYGVAHGWDAEANVCPSPQFVLQIYLVDGPGEEYEEIHVTQIETNNEEDNRSDKSAAKTSPVSGKPEYRTILDHFGDRIETIRH